MFLKKICVFLPVVFLAVDMFLLSLCFETRKNLSYLSETMMTDAVNYFESCGVTVRSSVIKEKIPDNAVYTFLADNASLAPEIAQKLADAYFPDSPVSFVETPDGVAYSIGNAGTAASFRVTDGSYRFEYSESGFSKDLLPALSTEPFTSQNPQLDDRQTDAVHVFMQALSAAKSDRRDYTLQGVLTRSDGVYVCLSQNIAGAYPVNDMFVNLYLREDHVAYACGNRMFAALQRSYSQPLIDGVNALRSLELDGVKEILSEQIVYVHRSTGGDTYYLIPVWKITYLDTDGVFQTQYVDAIKK